ncbi:MAG TPA: hypothetical protein VD927_10975 [Chryseosolibacter sp.]|nr:hypothetical protein [Chryseosolibacter sp.]
MSTNTTDSEQIRKVERSRAYPGISLEEAITFSQTISKSFTASQTINRDDIAAVLGKKGSIDRTIAASVQFGLFSKEPIGDRKSGYRLSPIVKQITHYVEESERKRNIIECFKAPQLFKELIEKYDKHAVPPLKPILIRFHGITENAAEDAENIFRASAQYCGALDDKGLLNIEAALKTSNVQYAEVITEEPEPQQQPPVLQLPANEPRLNENLEGEKVKIRLPGKRYAYLIYPDDIDQTDVTVLRKEIEKLEIIAKK